jgi:hypothetical protein
MSFFDIKKITDEAQAEINADRAAVAKSKIKASLKTIELAKRALANAEREHEVLLRDIGSE